MPPPKWPDHARHAQNAPMASGSSGARWPGGPRPGNEQPRTANATSLHRAEGLLVELYTATRGLGDALDRAGFPASAWRAPEARLTTLGDRMPNVTLETLMSRLADFALDTGPILLARKDEALDAFEHEVQALGAAVWPLSALAQQQRPAPVTRLQLSLKQALQDERVALHLDRLAETLHALLELSARLDPMSPTPLPPSAQASAAMASAAVGSGMLWGEQQESAAAPTWTAGQTGYEQALDELPDGPGALRGARWLGALKGARWPDARLLREVWSRRRARVGLGVGLAALLLVLALTGTFAILHALTAVSVPGTASAVGGRAVATASLAQGVAPSPAQTSAAEAPTQTPAPARAALAVSPGSVVLPCAGTAVTLTIRNTGGQTLTWQASVSGSASLSAPSGSVDAGSQATVDVHATGTQHGTGTIVFTSNGGTSRVSFKISCR